MARICDVIDEHYVIFCAVLFSWYQNGLRLYNRVKIDTPWKFRKFGGQIERKPYLVLYHAHCHVIALLKMIFVCIVASHYIVRPIISCYFYISSILHNQRYLWGRLKINFLSPIDIFCIQDFVSDLFSTDKFTRSRIRFFSKCGLGQGIEYVIKLS